MITAEDLEAHNKGPGGWLVISNNVYDIKNVLDQCGVERLREYVGRDATKAFETAGHSDNAVEMMEQCYVGQFKVVCSTSIEYIRKFKISDKIN